MLMTTKGNSASFSAGLPRTSWRFAYV